MSDDPTRPDLESARALHLRERFRQAGTDKTREELKADQPPAEKTEPAREQPPAQSAVRSTSAAKAIDPDLARAQALKEQFQRAASGQPKAPAKQQDGNAQGIPPTLAYKPKGPMRHVVDRKVAHENKLKEYNRKLKTGVKQQKQLDLDNGRDKDKDDRDR
jgi:hypothetical protein